MVLMFESETISYTVTIVTQAMMVLNLVVFKFFLRLFKNKKNGFFFVNHFFFFLFSVYTIEIFLHYYFIMHFTFVNN
jgi:hypothetical protein